MSRWTYRPAVARKGHEWWRLWDADGWPFWGSAFAIGVAIGLVVMAVL